MLSNLLNVFVSALIVLIIPKFIGVYEYGMWQIFTFYASYVGVLHLGWADGLFLRRGGQELSEMNSSQIRSEMVLFFLFNLLIGLVVILVSIFSTQEYQFIIVALGAAIIITNFRIWITMLLQATGQFKKFSINLSAQSLIYIILIFTALFLNIRDYKFMIIAFLLSQVITSLTGIYQIKEYISGSPWDFKGAMFEAKMNISVGSKLMVANFTALLILGVIRFGIQQKWSVATFGKISLVLTIANLMMVFINAISLVLFPTLRRTPQNIKAVYQGVRNVLMPLLFCMMIIYFPIKLLIPIWLPKYAAAIRFSAVLMPMMVYQGKFEILSNTFMKNLRMENQLLGINIVTLLISVVLTWWTVFYEHKLVYAVLSIAVVMAFRSVLAEIILRRKINMPFRFEIITETIIVIGFMLATWYLKIYVSFFIFMVGMLIIVLTKRRAIKSGFVVVKELSNY